MSTLSNPDVTFAWQRPRIVLFGDSLTERGFEPAGWAGHLAHYYSRKADVINRGLSGYNTRWALHVKDAALQAGGSSSSSGGSCAGSLLLVVIFFGANDAARMDGPPHSIRQHVPLPEYREGLAAMVGAARAAGARHVLLVTPPPVDDEGRKKHQRQRVGEDTASGLPLDRTLEHTRGYAHAARSTAEEAGVPCLDLFTLMQQDPEWRRLLSDGLHFTAAGQKAVFAHMAAALKEHMPDILPDQLPRQFPDWDQIDPAHPARTFGTDRAP